MEKKTKICDICERRVAEQKCIICKKDLCDDCKLTTKINISFSFDREVESKKDKQRKQKFTITPQALYPQPSSWQISPPSFYHSNNIMDVLICQRCAGSIKEDVGNEIENTIKDNIDKILARLRKIAMANTLAGGKND